jgi:hypothetical protein
MNPTDRDLHIHLVISTILHSYPNKFNSSISRTNSLMQKILSMLGLNPLPIRLLELALWRKICVTPLLAAMHAWPWYYYKQAFERQLETTCGSSYSKHLSISRGLIAKKILANFQKSRLQIHKFMWFFPTKYMTMQPLGINLTTSNLSRCFLNTAPQSHF